MNKLSPETEALKERLYNEIGHLVRYIIHIVQTAKKKLPDVAAEFEAVQVTYVKLPFVLDSLQELLLEEYVPPNKPLLNRVAEQTLADFQTSGLEMFAQAEQYLVKRYLYHLKAIALLREALPPERGYVSLS